MGGAGGAGGEAWALGGRERRPAGLAGRTPKRAEGVAGRGSGVGSAAEPPPGAGREWVSEGVTPSGAALGGERWERGGNGTVLGAEERLLPEGKGLGKAWHGGWRVRVAGSTGHGVGGWHLA